MSRHWPLFDLRVRTPRVVLRPFTDADLDALCDLALQGVHDPGHMPFTTPWTDLPPHEQVLGNMQYVWRRRADWTVEDWSLGLGAWEDGALVGRQDVFAQSFPVLRSVETGSWVGLAHQGRGLGKELRSAVLHLAFAGLGAQRADTCAFDDNERSLGVTRALGYVRNGDSHTVRRGEPARLLRYTLDAATWAGHRRDDVTIEGLDACRPLFGL